MNRSLLLLLALVHVVRFAVPALVGASGGGPFGEPWLADGVGSLLLDSDIRYWGVLCLVIAGVLVVLSFDIERHLALVDLVLAGVFLGGLIRLGEVLLVGGMPVPGLIATAVELGIPAVFWGMTMALRTRRRVRLARRLEIDAPASAVWHTFADYAGVGAWHPYMASAVLEDGPPEGLGARRLCSFGPKMAIRETVAEWDDQGRSMHIDIDFVKGFAPPIRDLQAAVHVSALGPARSRLVLSMAFTPVGGPLGAVLAEVVVLPMYAGVFDHMLAAASLWARERKTLAPVAMPGSGRVVRA